MNSGIYQILNKVNGKVYVGSSATIEVRWKIHKGELGRGVHGNTHLQNAYSKYGPEAFEYFVIEYCCPIKEILLEKEQFWMDALKVIEKGYNINPTAGSMLGRVHSKETKKKIFDAIKGENHWLYGKPKEAHPNYGKKFSEEHKEKLRQSHLGQPSWNKGKHGYMSKEHRKSISEAQQKNITFEDRTMCIDEWAKEMGISPGTLYSRLNNGWTVEKTLTVDSNKKNEPIEYNGQKKTVKEWAEYLEIKYHTLLWRIKNWPIEKALTVSVRLRGKKNEQGFGMA